MVCFTLSNPLLAHIRIGFQPITQSYVGGKWQYVFICLAFLCSLFLAEDMLICTRQQIPIIAAEM